jgi:hypothetical protein
MLHGADLQNFVILDGLLCRKEKEAKPVLITHKDPGVESVGPESGSRIVCRFCRNYITATRTKIEMRGRHTHVFANPAGVVFEVGCFSIDKGTGLGLAVSSGIINKHGGSIDVKSQPGKGATFTITLPISADKSIP